MGTNGLADDGHAVVVGGSIAGLMAARVLSDHVGHVTVVDRDGLPERPGFRKGVPQSRHQHIFLPRGRRIAERLFPGIEDELLYSGAELMDVAEDGNWLTPAGPAPRFHSGVALIGCTRELIEGTIRRRVASLPGVRFLQHADVARLLPGPGGRVAGVVLRFRGRNRTGLEEPLRADLVVDASGRNSDAPYWLEEIGYAPPEETTINAHPGYATRLFERPEDPGRDWTFVLVQTAPPEYNRGGVLSPVEGGRWMCSLIGLGGDHPPTDEEGFMAFARSLRDRTLYQAIEGAVPLSPIHGYREIENRRRRYERVPRLPDNLLIIGDAACSFNPVYGQGMTTAAIGAEILEGCLGGRRGGDLAGLSRRFQRKLAKANAAPWLLATGEDLRVRGTADGRPGLPIRLTYRYMDRVLALSLHDLRVRRTFLEVFGMLRPPTSLFGPAIVAKVLRRELVRPGKANGTIANGQQVQPGRHVRHAARRASPYAAVGYSPNERQGTARPTPENCEPNTQERTPADAR